MKATIEQGMYSDEIVALDEDRNVIAKRSKRCNPAALRQLICDVEMNGYEIDWDDSGVAQPEDL